MGLTAGVPACIGGFRTAPANSARPGSAQQLRHLSATCRFSPIWYVSGVPRSALAHDASVARTIRFPADLRDRITTDADRCGRSFEGQVIALLRSHYGEDVDIAPNPADILAFAKASLADIPSVDADVIVGKLKSVER